EEFMEMLPIAAVLLVGVIVGFINIVSAGGSMLTLPLLIFFGLPSNVANGTNRIAIMFQNTFALYQFHKNWHLNWRLGLMLAIPVTISSLSGDDLAIDITNCIFYMLIATFMIIFALLFIIMPQRYIKSKFNTKVSLVILFLTFLLIR